MGTKIKGLFKGLRYISQIFDVEKEQEMQIGYPTDVKHVAHIGWDGPSTAVHPPSWMNEFKSPGFNSAPASPGGDSRKNPPLKCVSEDSKRNRRLPELPKSSRTDLRFHDPSPKIRHSRRNQSASATDSPSKESSSPSSTNLNLQQMVPKKSRHRKKKSKDLKDSANSGTGSSSRSSRARSEKGPANDYTPPFSDPGTGVEAKLNDEDFCPKSPLERHRELVV